MKEGPLQEAMVFNDITALLRDYPEHLSIQSGGLQALAHLLRSGQCVCVCVGVWVCDTFPIRLVCCCDCGTSRWP